MLGNFLRECYVTITSTARIHIMTFFLNVHLFVAYIFISKLFFIPACENAGLVITVGQLCGQSVQTTAVWV